MANSRTNPNGKKMGTPGKGYKGRISTSRRCDMRTHVNPAGLTKTGASRGKCRVPAH